MDMSCNRCYHSKDAHTHWRKGTECALCMCPKYRTPRWWNLWRLPRATRKGSHA